MLIPDYLTTNQSEECPWADHAPLLEHYKTPHYPLQGGTHSLEGRSQLCPPFPGKARKLFFSTSSKTLVSTLLRGSSEQRPSFGNTHPYEEPFPRVPPSSLCSCAPSLREVCPCREVHYSGLISPQLCSPAYGSPLLTSSSWGCPNVPRLNPGSTMLLVAPCTVNAPCPAILVFSWELHLPPPSPIPTSNEPPNPMKDPAWDPALPLPRCHISPWIPATASQLVLQTPHFSMKCSLSLCTLTFYFFLKHV